MNRKHRLTLEKIKQRPERADLAWKDIEDTLAALGAEITEGRGSRVRVYLNSVRTVFHRPQPQKEASNGAVKSVRKFLETAGE